ncbi:signal peptidase I [Flavobacterium sedimenticola]|uniref:Signal peptidase I n=1 Tax=Flavobacterium sedimenticola TaxID=3043286 RepID=A0ABT6XQC6_9FLAO|nr:signal peptidase I [Flavobacterium sedimenticola]MDI9257190.1 signal peptidase I [Flavobacterium sedimenticola]
MSTYQWLVFFLIIQLIHGLGTWKLYEKAGRKRWEAFVPVYNAITLMKIINRPTWWTLLLFIPIINLIMIPVVWVETLRSFGKNSTIDTWLGLFTLGFYIYYVNYTQNVTHITDRSLVARTKTGDTVSSIIFAVVVATLVHTYVMQPFTIPTSSLEKTLLVGDFLFVSKFHYGARTPITSVAAPMVHDTLPLLNTKSYLSRPQYPYFRFPGFEKIERNDIVVFNWPVDTVYYFRDPSGRYAYKPIDKKSNYVKRCVGIPGDQIQIKNSELFVNNQPLVLSDRAKPQYSYTAKFKYDPNFNYPQLFADLNPYENDRGGMYKDSILYFPALTDESVQKLKSVPGILEVTKAIDTVNTAFTYDFKYNPDVNDGFLNIINQIKESGKFRVEERDGNIIRIYNLPADVVNLIKQSKAVKYCREVYEIFPHSEKQRNWTKDNLGPIYIPEAGKQVALSLETLPFYARIISDYEGNKLEVKGNDIYINDQKATTYTFQQNYYWMMGDNRHNSEDSRYWGFVPENHIVGKPVFIWMSWDSNGSGLNKIRWDRMFTTVSGEGQPESYFKYFLILLALYFVGDYFWKKKKNAKA